MLYFRETVLFIMISVAAVACIGGQDKTESQAHSAPTGCGALDPGACATEAQCAVIEGRPILDDGAGGQCVDFDSDRVGLGCMDADWGCGEAETLGRPPGGDCYWFPTTCLPTGWEVCEGSVNGC